MNDHCQAFGVATVQFSSEDFAAAVAHQNIVKLTVKFVDDLFHVVVVGAEMIAAVVTGVSVELCHLIPPSRSRGFLRLCPIAKPLASNHLAGFFRRISCSDEGNVFVAQPRPFMVSW
jgi:hypothetical protein